MLNSKFWNKYFMAYDVLNDAIPYQELLSEIIKQINLEKDNKVLDAGSGTGNLSMMIKEKGSIPYGLDFSEEGIKIHKTKDNQANVIRHNLTQRLPFEDEFFDRIVTNNVIYTIDKEKREDVFREFYRVLKPGGRIVVANIHEGFKPYKIFFAHLKKSFKTKGVSRTLYDLLTLGYVTGKIFYYNYHIQKENKTGSYDFVENDEQKELLQKAGFKNISDNTVSYAGQSYINSAQKL